MNFNKGKTMKADKKLIDQISFGKISIEEKENGLFFRRTSDKVTKAFFNTATDFGEKTYASSCINFDFYTDSKTVKLEYCDVIKGSLRNWYYFDVVVNGALKVHTGHEDYTIDGSGEVVVNLDGNLNRVTIYSPMLVGYTLKSLTFDDGAKIIPVIKKCKILALGDSITHGYDETYSSFAYTNLISRYFDAEVVNQAVGGAFAISETVETEINPDYVLVFYGTNDWWRKEYQSFYDDYHDFVKTIKQTHTNATVFLVSPIYRADKSVSQAGDFSITKDVVSSACEKYGCVFIDGMTLAPHLTDFFMPDKVHPNDMGSFMYAFGLLEVLREYIK